jgi:hypothetical protein
VSFAIAETKQSEALKHRPSTVVEWKVKKPREYDCFCKLFETGPNADEVWRLNLTLSSAKKFKQHRSTSRLYEPDSLANPITLEKLLQTRDKGWIAAGKFTLGLILAYSLFYLYGGRWAKGRWGRKNIVFYENDGKIYPKPFLCSNPDKFSGPPLDDDSVHKFPEILELGVILLEIYIDQDLSSYLKLDPIADAETSNELFARTSRVFQKVEPQMMSTPYKIAIKWCLQSYHDFDQDNEELRTALFQQVISPLESEIRNAFHEYVSVDHLDKDSEAEKINLAPKQEQEEQVGQGGQGKRKLPHNPHDLTADDEHTSKRHRPDDSQSTLLSMRSVCQIINCAQKCKCIY